MFMYHGDVGFMNDAHVEFVCKIHGGVIFMCSCTLHHVSMWSCIKRVVYGVRLTVYRV